jgi:hypothetical protein
MSLPASRPRAATPNGDFLSIWLLILIIVVVVLLLGGFGYSRR